MVFVIEFKAQGVLKKFTKLNSFLVMEVPNLTKAQAEEGLLMAQRLAPRDSGALIQAIRSEPAKKRNNNVGYSIVSRTPKNSISPKRRQMTNPRGVPYHVYQEKGTRYNRPVLFMDRTMTYLEKTYPEVFRKNLQRVLRS